MESKNHGVQTSGPDLKTFLFNNWQKTSNFIIWDLGLKLQGTKNDFVLLFFQSV